MSSKRYKKNHGVFPSQRWEEKLPRNEVEGKWHFYTFSCSLTDSKGCICSLSMIVSITGK